MDKIAFVAALFVMAAICIVLAFEHGDDFLEMAEGHEFLLEEFPRNGHRRIGEIAGRYEESARLIATDDPNQVLRNLGNANRRSVPLHLDEVDMALHFDDAVDLFYDAFASVTNNVERL